MSVLLRSLSLNTDRFKWRTMHTIHTIQRMLRERNNESKIRACEKIVDKLILIVGEELTS